MPSRPVSAAKRRLAISAFMLVFGIGMASWVVRTPAVRDLLAASTAEMGLVLLGLSVGSMSGVLSSAAVVRRQGVRFTVVIGGASFVTGIALTGLFAELSTPFGVAAGLALVGFGIGISEIALNVEGAALETLTGRSVLPALHGFYSLGTVTGAVAGIGLTAIDFPVVWQLVGVAVVALALLLTVIRSIPVETGRVERAVAGAPREKVRSTPVWQQPRVLMLGLIVLALALAEGSATDWLPLLMVDGHGVSATVGTVVFTAFAAAMTVGRFLGTPLLARFGKATVLLASTLVSAVGIGIVVFADNAVVAGAAVVLWGLGAALGFPVTLSAAGESEDPTSAVAAVATAGYIAFLVGPPLLGFLGEHFGLRGAMAVVLVLVALASLLTSAAKPRVPREPVPA
ncbi:MULTISPECIES: MFS transporter [unclassified Rathayibacter]|uniref:MFS transporter n=1 Tax=unclassified Rathayibacter TaxID=2609250 RepID=UPI000F4BB070|nr:MULTISPECIES: MFS transporter [unclassified Rathayibacter]ROP48665.1 fucose permease [Rathayibacter sp. PhB186]ROS49814.1 fucose permease [Rathayibacter sp. PhB185]TCL80119.1 fucose permease [Rathayibacter sp. PhB192]TCM25560.1 fucose permease [Rathayibacter sp. PhB179]